MIIKDYSTLEKLADLLRSKYTIGFTNGIFDLLHDGHVTLLKNAKKHCDVLIVAINSDTSTRKIKGPKRPILPEDIRTKILDTIKYVDIVTVMQETDPTRLLEIIRPHVFFKGGEEYRDISKYPEGDLLKKHGIKYVWINTPSTHTTDIINEIVTRYGDAT